MRMLIPGLMAIATTFLTCTSAFADFDAKENFTRVDRGMAHRLALTQAHGYIKNSDLDMRNGRPRWKVQVRGAYGQKSEVFIDAMTGAVLGVKFRG